MTLPHATWYFTSTWEAYTATQVRNEIAHGDCLVIRGATDSVVGFLFHAWPVAITAEVGGLHGLRPSVTPWIVDGENVRSSLEQAVQLARELGLPLDHHVEEAL